MRALKIQHLTFKYHHEPILHNLNATFNPGTINLITGPSGTGKSTLLKIMARLINKPTSGFITYGNVPLSSISKTKLSNYVAMMFQDPNRQFAMRTVKHELIFTFENRRIPVNQIADRVNQTLKRNHLFQFKNRKLATLSGGEKQRVALAIITALNSKVILLDEPFTNVDHHSKVQIMQRLLQLKSTGKIIIIVDHNLSGYLSSINQFFIMKNGQLHPAKLDPFINAKPIKPHQWNLPKSKVIPEYQLSQFEVGYQRPLISTNHFSFYPHCATLITGPNGAGKSTLFRALLKLIKYHGEITYEDHPLTQLKAKNYYRHVNLVFQEPTDQFLEITVRQELALSIKNLKNPQYVKKQLNPWLKFTGLGQHLNQVVYSLSGGQQRSLQLIEALLSNAPVMLMDEPFQSLDHRLISFFKKWLKIAVKKKHRTLIVISHQIAPVADLFDYHVQLKNGQFRYLRGLNP